MDPRRQDKENRNIVMGRVEAALDLQGMMAMLLGAVALFTRQKFYAYGFETSDGYLAILLQLSVFVCLPFGDRDSLRLAGGVLQAQALPSVWPLHEIPGEAYSFILALCQYYGIMHELRLPKSVRPDAPPFSSNAMAEAMVVPYFLAPKSSGLGSGLLSRAIGTDSLMYQRRYELQSLPETLRTQLLYHLLDVTSIHSAVWNTGLICSPGKGRDFLMAEWKDKDVSTGPSGMGSRNLSSLRLVFVVSRHGSAGPIFLHTVVTTVEEVMARWFPKHDFKCICVRQDGRACDLESLITDLLTSHDERILLNLAPDLVVSRSTRIAASELSGERKEIGAGSFGMIELTSWKGKQVVLKKLIVDEASSGTVVRPYRDFLRESWMMSMLRHPKVIRLEGFILQPLAMVLEYCNGGDLRSFLDTHEGLDWKVRLSLLRDVALGINLHHQHAPAVVHRDIKSPNIFIHRSDVRGIEARVGDLGLATFLAGSYEANMVDNPSWSAPEVIRKADKVTEKADVFSFAIVMWELWTGLFPYADAMAEFAGFMSRLSEAIENRDLRPTLPPDNGSADPPPPGFVDLMTRCWSPRPSERPSFFEVLHRLLAVMVAEERAQPSPAGLSFELSEFGRIPKICGQVCVSGSLLYIIHRPSRHVAVLSAVTGAFVRCFRTPAISNWRCELVPVKNEGCLVVILGASMVYSLSVDAPIFGVTGICEPQAVELETLTCCSASASSSGEIAWIHAISSDEGVYWRLEFSVSELKVRSKLPLTRLATSGVSCSLGDVGGLLLIKSQMPMEKSPMRSSSGATKLSQDSRNSNSKRISGIVVDDVLHSPRAELLTAAARSKLETKELMTSDEMLALLANSEEGLKDRPTSFGAVQADGMSPSPSRERMMSLNAGFSVDFAPRHGAAQGLVSRVIFERKDRLLWKWLIFDSRELWLLLDHGHLIILDLQHDGKIVYEKQIELTCRAKDTPLDMIFVADGTWCVIASPEMLVALPSARIADTRVISHPLGPAHEVEHVEESSNGASSPGSISLAGIKGLPAFYVATNFSIKRWCLSRVEHPTSANIKIQSQKRAKTEVESQEARRREADLVQYRQRKELILDSQATLPGSFDSDVMSPRFDPAAVFIESPRPRGGGGGNNSSSSPDVSPRSTSPRTDSPHFSPRDLTISPVVNPDRTVLVRRVSEKNKMIFFKRRSDSTGGGESPSSGSPTSNNNTSK